MEEIFRAILRRRHQKFAEAREKNVKSVKKKIKEQKKEAEGPKRTLIDFDLELKNVDQAGEEAEEEASASNYKQSNQS